jgi:hypothetical protein
MDLSTHNDKPRESWNDRRSMTQDLSKLMKRFSRTTSNESQPVMSYRQVDRSLINFRLYNNLDRYHPHDDITTTTTIPPSPDTFEDNFFGPLSMIFFFS